MRDGLARELVPSVDELLTPAALSEIEGRSVTSVRRGTFASVDSLSGSRFLAAVTDGDGGERRYVLKRISREWDWIMRATGDDRGRAAVAWTSGLLDSLPSGITSEVVGCARDGNGWALLLRDVREFLIPPGDSVISTAEHERFVEAMAALHVEFWGRPEMAEPAMGFCSLEQRYSEFLPAVSRAETEGTDPIPPLIGRGWETALGHLDPGVRDDVAALLDDPSPLARALGRYPQTVVHGDWKLGNLGLKTDGAGTAQAILLDWAVVGPAPPAVDLAWYLAVNCDRMPVSKETAIEQYKVALASKLGGRLESWWEEQLDLALLGGFVQLGWAKGLGLFGEDVAGVARARAEFSWWAERLPQGLVDL